MTLPHTIANGPGNALDADELMANFEALVNPDGSVPMTGDLDMGGNAINGVSAINDSFLLGRNRIVNGAMEFDQRNEGGAYTIDAASVVRTLDCWWSYGQASDGVFTVQRLTTTPPAGFTHYQQFKTTTADASIAAGQVYFGTTKLEGTRMRGLAFGTASAKAITLSFWARASATGTYGGSLRNDAGNRTYPFTFSIAAADTWEKQAITIAGETTGTWAVTTTGWGQIIFDLGCGTNYKGTADAWATSDFFGVTGATNLIATLNATLDITGVQLEPGNVSTEFEHLPTGDGLRQVQRYHVRYGSPTTIAAGSRPVAGLVTSTTALNCAMPLPVPMRATPTLTQADWTVTDGVAAPQAVTVVTAAYLWSGILEMGATVAANLTAGNAGQLRSSSTSSYIDLTAEL